MTTKAHKISERCEGTPCTQLWRKVPGGWGDVTLLGVTITTLDWNSGNAIPGSQAPRPLNNLDRELLFHIRDALGLTRSDNRAEGRVIDYGSCESACYCYVADDAQPRNESQHEEELNWEFDYIHVTWMSRFVVNGQNRFFNSATGRPISPQPHQNVVGPVAMNPGVSMAPSWKLLTKYRAKVRAKVKYIKYQLDGECRQYPVEGGFPV